MAIKNDEVIVVDDQNVTSKNDDVIVEDNRNVSICHQRCVGKKIEEAECSNGAKLPNLNHLPSSSSS